jgi:hypothetical protein
MRNTFNAIRVVSVQRDAVHTAQSSIPFGLSQSLSLLTGLSDDDLEIFLTYVPRTSTLTSLLAFARRTSFTFFFHHACLMLVDTLPKN